MRAERRAIHRLTWTSSASFKRFSRKPSVVLQGRTTSATAANDTTHTTTVSTQSPRAQQAKTQTSSSLHRPLLLGAFIVKVLDRAHQFPLLMERQCRPRTSGVENLDCDPRRQRQILQRNADLGQALATLEPLHCPGREDWIATETSTR